MNFSETHSTYFQIDYGFPKYPGSSLEDLMILFETEKKIINLSNEEEFKKIPTFMKLVQSYSSQIDYDL